MRVFTVFYQKPLLRPFFQMDIHTQLIYMYSVLCLVYMTCKDTSLLLQRLTNVFFVLKFWYQI